MLFLLMQAKSIELFSALSRTAILLLILSQASFSFEIILQKGKTAKCKSDSRTEDYVQIYKRLSNANVGRAPF